MPQRPRSHRLEADARRELKEAFDGACGWIVEDLHQDYGEDLLVRIFRQGKATPLSFFVQSKSTDGISRFRRRSLKFSVTISKRHMRHWARFWEPVFVTLYDSKSRKTYWECVQIFLETEDGRKRLRRRGKTLVIEIPEANILDNAGVKRIYHITKLRFRRHYDEKAVVEALMSLLEERAGLKVAEYNSHTGILILEDRKKRHEHVFFGRGKKLVECIPIFSNAIYNRILSQGLKRMQATFQRDYKTGQISILDENGTIIEQYATLKDWHFSERIKEELRDPDESIKLTKRQRRELVRRLRQPK